MSVQIFRYGQFDNFLSIIFTVPKSQMDGRFVVAGHFSLKLKWIEQ